MSADRPFSEIPQAIERAAADWVARLDRGLTAVEQDNYSKWMAEDSRHRDAIARHRWGWDELDRLAGLHASPHAHLDPDLLAPKGRQRLSKVITWVAPALVAAAAAIAVVSLERTAAPVAPVSRSIPTRDYSLTAPCVRQSLEDGSIADLDRGAAIEVHFSKEFRRIHLVRGEAKFSVAKNPARPFIVEAGGVEVQAVGTVFDVQLNTTKVDVIVSEGTVKLREPAHPYAETPFVHAGQEAVAILDSGAMPAIETLSDAGLSQRIAWEPKMLHFDDLPLAEIVAEFNAHNTVQLRIADPDLAGFRLSAAFRSDNVEGFVRLLVFDFGMRADHLNEGEIVLRRAE